MLNKYKEILRSIISENKGNSNMVYFSDTKEATSIAVKNYRSYLSVHIIITDNGIWAEKCENSKRLVYTYSDSDNLFYKKIKKYQKISKKTFDKNVSAMITEIKQCLSAGTYDENLDFTPISCNSVELTAWEKEQALKAAEKKIKKEAKFGRIKLELDYYDYRAIISKFENAIYQDNDYLLNREQEIIEAINGTNDYVINHVCHYYKNCMYDTEYHRGTKEQPYFIVNFKSDIKEENKELIKDLAYSAELLKIALIKNKELSSPEA